MLSRPASKQNSERGKGNLREGWFPWLEKGLSPGKVKVLEAFFQASPNQADAAHCSRDGACS